jgi:tetratricopeptide (TPR) repeat protein
VSKQPSNTRQTKGGLPAPAQIKAVERLLGARDYPRAIARARTLVQHFPDHGGANRLLLDALDQGESRAAATLAAYQWAERRPRSVRALEALFQLAIEGHHLLLAYRVADRLRELGALTGASHMNLEGLAEMLQQPDGSAATRAQAEQFDIGQLHLNVHDFAGAARVLDGVAITSARNNRGFALFHVGRIEEALTAFLDAWQHDAGNLFALDWALRLRLYLGDETGARGLAVPLVQAQARRAEDAYGQVAGLLLIHEDQAAWDAFERAGQAVWAAGETGPLWAERLQQGGGAASRLGDAEQARALWRQALAQRPGLTTAAENLAALQRDGAPPAYPALFEWSHMLPVGWVHRLHAAGATHLNARLDELTASDAYLETIYLAGDASLRTFAAQLLKHRLKRESVAQPPAGGQPERHAAAIVRDLARVPVGTVQERRGLLHALREAGLSGADETLCYWDGKALSEVKLIATEIYRAPVLPDLPEDLQLLLEQSRTLMRDGDLVAAEARLQAILRRVPDYQIALGNLAAIRARQGRDSEYRELLHRVIAAHPDYLFARCNLAGLLIEDGELEAAKELLDGLALRSRLHIQEAFALYGAMAMLNRAQGADASADTLMASLEQMVETDDDQRLLAVAKARVARATAGGRLLETFRSLLPASKRSGRV